jgi:hypothetical protein
MVNVDIRLPKVARGWISTMSLVHTRGVLALLIVFFDVLTALLLFFMGINYLSNIGIVLVDGSTALPLTSPALYGSLLEKAPSILQPACAPHDVLYVNWWIADLRAGLK